MTCPPGKTRTSWFLGLLVSLIAAPLLISCGGSGSMATTPGGSQPPGSGGGASARYLYIGLAMNQGGLQGFKVDNSSGALTEVPGSPLLFGGVPTNQFTQAGVLAAANGHVFAGFGPPNFAPPVIRSFAIDHSSGSWGNFTETNAGATSGDEQMRALVTDPGNHNLYAVYQNSIASFQINSDGSLTPVGSITNLATAFTFSLAIDPAANIAFLGVDNCPPKGACGGPPDILLLSRDASTGALTNTNKFMGQNSVWSPGALAFDPTGKFLVAWMVDTSGANSITVFSVDAAAGTLTKAAGPVAIGANLSPSSFAFDSSGKFLYVQESTGASPQPMNVAVFSFNPSTGAITQAQSQALAPGNFPAGLLVDDSFVYVFASQAGTMPSVIYVLKRDASAGTVSAPVFSLQDRPGGLQSGVGQAAELRF